ncbi:MAG: YaeQ family protein [Burkholderiales bacterium]|nr:YaeQ family protein [Burkholderiales bacterium]
MALSATIYKVDLQLSDMDRGHYDQYSLTVACHPSETTERMMLRVVAFARHASEALKFTRGLSSDDEPDLWEHHDHGEIKTWIELGLPEERRMRQASGRSDEVFLYTIGGRAVPVWWQQNASAMRKLEKLSIYSLSEDTLKALDEMTARTMQLSCTIQDGTMWLADGTHNLEVIFETLQDKGRQTV